MESPNPSSSSERARPEPVLISIRKTDEYAKMTKLAVELKQGEDTDYIIESNGEKLACHKDVLAMHSPWIEQMIDNDTTTQNQNVFEGYRIDILRLILDFMYKGAITFDKSKLYRLMVAAHMLNVPFLKEESAGIIIRDLTPENAISWWWCVRDSCTNAIENHCKDFFATHLVELAHTQCFLEMDYVDVKLYFETAMDSYSKHDDVLFSVLEWVEYRIARYKYLKDLLRLINLQNCFLKSLLNLLNRYVEIVGEEKFNRKIYKTLSKAIKSKTGRIEGEHKLCIVGELTGLNCMQVYARHMCWAIIDEMCPMVLHSIPFDNLKPKHSVCETAEGFIISGGVDSTLCVMYNVYTVTWTRLKDLPEPRMYHASLCIKEVLYVFGGEVAGTPSGSVQCLELAEIGGQWKEYIDLPEPAFRASKPNRKTIIAAVNASVYLFGNDLCMYRLIIGRDVTWCRLSTCDPTLGSLCSMSHAFGKLYAIGDRTFAWYNLDTDRWEKGQLPSEIFSISYDQTTPFTLVCLDKNVCFRYARSVYKYRVDTQTWHVDVDGVRTDYSHIIVMHIPKKHLKAHPMRI